MGAKISTLDNNNNNNSNSQIKLGDYDLQDITPLGKKPVTPINIKTLIEKKKVYPKTEAADKLKDIAETFDDIVDKKNDRINSLIRYETLLMNYSNKNREVLKELDNRISEQQGNLKNEKENNYTKLIKARNLMKVNAEYNTTHRIMIISIILIALIGATAGLLLLRKKMMPGGGIEEIRTI